MIFLFIITLGLTVIGVTYFLHKVVVGTAEATAEMVASIASELLYPSPKGEAEVIHTEQEQMYEQPPGWAMWEQRD